MNSNGQNLLSIQNELDYQLLRNRVKANISYEQIETYFAEFQLEYNRAELYSIRIVSALELKPKPKNYYPKLKRKKKISIGYIPKRFPLFEQSRSLKTQPKMPGFQWLTVVHVHLLFFLPTKVCNSSISVISDISWTSGASGIVSAALLTHRITVLWLTPVILSIAWIYSLPMFPNIIE